MITRGGKKKQKQMKNLNQHKNLETLSRNILFEPPIKRSQGRPRKYLLTDFNNTPFQKKERE